MRSLHSLVASPALQLFLSLLLGAFSTFAQSGVTVSLAPTNVTMAASGSFSSSTAFTAKVTGSTNTAVTWSVKGAPNYGFGGHFQRRCLHRAGDATHKRGRDGDERGGPDGVGEHDGDRRQPDADHQLCITEDSDAGRKFAHGVWLELGIIYLANTASGQSARLESNCHQISQGSLRAGLQSRPVSS